jgi:hypothetical protein
MSNKSNKVSVFYGRARRIELYEKIAYVAVGIIAAIVVVFIVTKQATNDDENVDFARLRTYMANRGFSCEMVHKPNGFCSKSNDTTSYTFTRYGDGFMYRVKTKSYTLEMVHSMKKENEIVFTTTSEAFYGYKNKTYSCSFNVSVLGDIRICKTVDDEILNLSSYKGVIEQAQMDVSNILESSGYYKDILLKDYKWQKK